MKKFFIALAAAICTLGSSQLPAQAADFSSLAETKVQLSDSFNASSFAAAYNKVSAYPVQGTMQPQTRGAYTAYLGPIDADDVLLLNDNQSGQLANIVLMHHGALTDSEVQKFRTIFTATLHTLGFPNDENAQFFIQQAYEQLAVTDPDIAAARLHLDGSDRTYRFLKTVDKEHQVTTLLIEAVNAQ